MLSFLWGCILNFLISKFCKNLLNLSYSQSTQIASGVTLLLSHFVNYQMLIPLHISKGIQSTTFLETLLSFHRTHIFSVLYEWLQTQNPSEIFTLSHHLVWTLYWSRHWAFQLYTSSVRTLFVPNQLDRPINSNCKSLYHRFPVQIPNVLHILEYILSHLKFGQSKIFHQNSSLNIFLNNLGKLTPYEGNSRCLLMSLGHTPYSHWWNPHSDQNISTLDSF